MDILGEDKTELDSMKTDAKAIMAELEVLQGKIDTEKDETRLKIYRDEYAKKSTEFDGVKEKLSKVKERVRDKEKIMREEMLAEIDNLAQSDVHGKDLRDRAAAGSQSKDDRIQMQAIGQYMAGKNLEEFPAQLRKKLSVKSDAFREGSGGIKLPPAAVDLVLGPMFRQKLSVAQQFKDALEGKTSCSGTGDYTTMPYASDNAYMSPAAIWTEYKRNLLEIPGEPADILSQVTMVPAQSGTAQWVRELSTDSLEYGAVTASWVTCEGDNKPATQKKFETFDISCFELATYTEITDRALRRSLVPIETILASNFRDAVKHSIETAILAGTGAGQPDGVIDVDGIHQVHRHCNNDVLCEDFIRLKYALRRQHRPGSIYVLQDNVAMEVEIDRYGGTDCECVTYCMDKNSILGYPYFSTHRLPALGTDGDVLFGNFRHYILAVEMDVIFERSSVAGDMFRKNSTAFKIYTIVGGEVSQPRAFAQLVGCAGGSCCCAT